MWRRRGSAVEDRTLDRENPVTNPLHILATAMLHHDNKNPCTTCRPTVLDTVIFMIFILFICSLFQYEVQQTASAVRSSTEVVAEVGHRIHD